MIKGLTISLVGISVAVGGFWGSYIIGSNYARQQSNTASNPVSKPANVNEKIENIYELTQKVVGTSSDVIEGSPKAQDIARAIDIIIADIRNNYEIDDAMEQDLSMLSFYINYHAYNSGIDHNYTDEETGLYMGVTVHTSGNWANIIARALVTGIDKDRDWYDATFTHAGEDSRAWQFINEYYSEEYKEHNNNIAHPKK